MRPPKNYSLLSIGLAVCDAMRHTGTSTITSDISAQMNGQTVEMVPDLLQEARKMVAQCSGQVVRVYLEPIDSSYCLRATSKTKGLRGGRIARPIHNTAPLRHYNNPRCFR